MPQVAERTRAISVTKLHPDIGAEIRGVDLSRPLDEETVRQIKDAWHQHAVLLFRDQNLSEDDQRRFASHFGPVAKRVPPKPGAPGAADALVWDDMMTISDRVDANGKALGSLGHGEMWFHADKCYHRQPHRATFLYGIEIPSEGGHTQFSSMYAAYENLPADLKRQLGGAMVVQGQQYGVGRRIDVTLPLESTHHCAQPIFVTNPGSGRKALYVASQNSMWIEGMDRDASEACCNGCSRSPRIRKSSTSTSGGLATSSCGTTSRACTRAPIGRANSAERCAAAPSRAGRCTGIHSANALRDCRETSPPNFSAHGRGCRGAAGVAAKCMAARLSDTAGARARRLSGRQRAGRHRPSGRATGRGPVGQQFFVENRSGAGSSLAAQDVVSAPADGYTLLARRQRQCRQRQPLRICLQFRARHRARRHDLQCPFFADGQSGNAGENFFGVHRLRESQSGPDQYGVAGHRNHAAPHVRAVEDDDGIELTHVPYRTGYIPIC